MFDFYITYWLLGIIMIPGIILASWAQYKVSHTYKISKTIPAKTDKTADQIAREILDRNHLEEVAIEPTNGELTDHYNPRTQVIKLSEGVYGNNSIAALSVAAHEVGHAIQRKEGHFATKLRTFLVPVINFSDRILWPILMFGIFFNIFGGIDNIVGTVFIWCGIAFFSLSVLFSLVTLPTELDASKRALQQLTECGYLVDEEDKTAAKKMLRAAALTYVASLLISILTLVRFIITIVMLKHEE